MLVYHVLEWVLPLVTLVAVVFCIYWYRLFTIIAFYSDLRNRPRRRRRWRRRTQPPPPRFN